MGALARGLRAGHRWLVLAGAAGVGKTSFVQGGVLPALSRGLLGVESSRWEVTTIDLASVALDQAAELLKTRPFPETKAATSQTPTRNSPENAELLVIDHMERMLHASEPGAGDRLEEALALALSQQSARPGVIVSVIRSDLLPELFAHSRLLPFRERAIVYTLRPLDNSQVRTVLAGYARLTGTRWESGLEERIVLELGGLPPSTLALLLRGLSGTPRADLLTHAAYDRVGGARGVFVRSAQASLESLSAAQLDVARRIVLALVALADADRPLRRVLPRGEALLLAGDGVSGEQAVDQLAEAGVVAITETGHLALSSDDLLATEPLRGWVTASLADLRLRDTVQRAAETWNAVDRTADALAGGAMLELVRRATARSRLVAEFLEAAEKREADSRREAESRERARAETVSTLRVVTEEAERKVQQMAADTRAAIDHARHQSERMWRKRFLAAASALSVLGSLVVALVWLAATERSRAELAIAQSEAYRARTEAESATAELKRQLDTLQAELSRLRRGTSVRGTTQAPHGTVRADAPGTQRRAPTASGLEVPLAELKIDIYYPKSRPETEKLASALLSYLKKALPKGRVTLAGREDRFFESVGLPRGNEVRFDPGRDDTAAKQLTDLLNNSTLGLRFVRRPVYSRTANALSVFVWGRAPDTTDRGTTRGVEPREQPLANRGRVEVARRFVDGRWRSGVAMRPGMLYLSGGIASARSSSRLAMKAELDDQTSIRALRPDLLGDRGITGDVSLLDGAVMVLAFTRAATKNADAIFQPAQVIRHLAQQVQEEIDLPENWMNNGAEAFVSPGRY